MKIIIFFLWIISSSFTINVIYIKSKSFNNSFLIFKLYATEIYADYNLIKTYILINLYLNSIFFSIISNFLRHYYSEKIKFYFYNNFVLNDATWIACYKGQWKLFIITGVVNYDHVNRNVALNMVWRPL